MRVGFIQSQVRRVVPGLGTHMTQLSPTEPILIYGNHKDLVIKCLKVFIVLNVWDCNGPCVIYYSKVDSVLLQIQYFIQRLHGGAAEGRVLTHLAPGSNIQQPLLISNLLCLADLIHSRIPFLYE